MLFLGSRTTRTQLVPAPASTDPASLADQEPTDPDPTPWPPELAAGMLDQRRCWMQRRALPANPRCPPKVDK